MSRQLLYLLAGLLSTPFCLTAQSVEGKVKLQQAQQIEINLETKTTIAQQAMGQSIDFRVH